MKRARKLRATLETRFHSIARSLPPRVLGRVMTPLDGRARHVTFLYTTIPASAGATIDLARAMVDAVLHHHGRIDRFLGNGVLAVFGTPAAREDDPERAMLCALEIRSLAGTRGFEAASAIHAGRVSFGLMGSDEHHELIAMGPVAAFALRLGARAVAGEIVASEAAFRSVQRGFLFSTVSLEVGGLEGMIRAHRLEGRQPRLEKVRGLDGMRAELVGREAELASLQSAWEKLLRGQGSLVTVTGEAGLGKSRLVAELKSCRHGGVEGGREVLWLEGRCIEMGVAAAFGPFVDLLAQHLGLVSQADEAVRAARLVQALEALQRGASLAAERVKELGPLLGRLLSIRFGSEWDARLAYAAPEQVRHQTCLAVRDVLLALARRQPIVVVLEDLHWADATSVDLTVMLMETAAAAPLLLVCVYRPDRDRPSWRLRDSASRACPGRHTAITLSELTPDQGRRMVGSLFAGNSLPAAVPEAILVRSQGNPFFVEELIRSMIESGAIYREGERWLAREEAPGDMLPGTLQGVILSRVDRLDPGPRRLLETAAVLGPVFHRRELEAAHGRGSAVGRDLSLLEDRALVRPGGAGGSEEYTFRHVLAQQAVYQGIPQRRRARLHAVVAGAIESLHADSLDSQCGRLAVHHEQAGNTERAVGCLLRAGRTSRDASLDDAAVLHFRHAIALLDASATPKDRIRLQILLELGSALETMGRHDPAEAALREGADLARSLACPPRELAPVHYWLARVLTARHRPEEYLPIAEESLSLLGNDTECAEAVWSEMVVAYGAFERGDTSRMHRFAARRRTLIRSLPYSPQLADDCAVIVMVLLMDKHESEAMDWLSWVEREARDHNDLLGLAAVHVRWGRDLAGQRGDRIRAIEAIEQAIGIYGRIGSRYREARCHLYAGDVQYRFGMLDEAEACLQRARAAMGGLEGHGHLRAEGDMLEGQLAMARGDARGALASFQSALSARPGEQWERFLRYLSGCALLELGRKQDAMESFVTVLGAAFPFRPPPSFSTPVELAHLLSLLESSDDGGSGSLEPATPGVSRESAVVDTSGWTWHDPFGDCLREVDGGIVVAAGPGRGLWRLNTGAPRLVLSVSGDFVLQATVGPADDERPCVGGLLAWKSERDYLRLDAGWLAPGSVAFCGCAGNRDAIIGHGRLRVGRVVLRLERSGPVVRALCSVDGVEWHAVGEADFAVGDPLQVGVFADGAIRPEVYPRSYLRGSQVRFCDIQLG